MTREYVTTGQARETIAQAHERLARETSSPRAREAARKTRVGLLPVFCSLRQSATR